MYFLVLFRRRPLVGELACIQVRMTAFRYRRIVINGSQRTIRSTLAAINNNQHIDNNRKTNVPSRITLGSQTKYELLSHPGNHKQHTEWVSG